RSVAPGEVPAAITAGIANASDGFSLEADQHFAQRWFCAGSPICQRAGQFARVLRCTHRENAMLATPVGGLIRDSSGPLAIDRLYQHDRLTVPSEPPLTKGEARAVSPACAGNDRLHADRRGPEC